MKTIQSIPNLRNEAQRVFNKFIRLRDADKGCITCGKDKIEQACHFYSAGQYSGLRFNEMNVHGGCIHCNYYKHGDLSDYRAKIVKRIGEQNLMLLDLSAKQNRVKKWSRVELIAIIEHYKKEIEKL